MTWRRVAFFTDSFHEVNGVALTSREFIAFAQRHQAPVLSIHAGSADGILQEGSVTTLEFRRRWLRWNLEHDLAFDWLFLRHRKPLKAALVEFHPDLIHITGPSDAGILGAMLAYDLRVPLVASWHTNLHEFGARRLGKVLSPLPAPLRSPAVRWFERTALDQCVRFYRLAKLIFAPNPELVEMLERRTSRPAFLMSRGIDVNLYSPLRRSRSDGDFVIGYVGRLSPEKNVRMLAQIERALIAAGCTGYRFLIAGEGSERSWLRGALQRAELPGILRGEALARAYASMDVFIFPSSTDTFGNVVLEAMASGVPAIVTAEGGPKFLVTPGRNGDIAASAEGFAAAILNLWNHPELLTRMRGQALDTAQRFSWDAVFQQVHRAYEVCFAPSEVTVQSQVDPPDPGVSQQANFQVMRLR
jgi:glycosyltransferase involved in cell wall biosynthesis